MIVIRLPQEDGTVLLHTFHGPACKSYESESELWASAIHDVGGYKVDSNAPDGCSMISLARAEWVVKMLEEYPNDCKEAARKLAVRARISINKSKLEKKSSPKKKAKSSEPDTTTNDNKSEPATE